MKSVASVNFICNFTAYHNCQRNALHFDLVLWLSFNACVKKIPLVVNLRVVDLHGADTVTNMSRLMTKPIMWLCAQRRLRSAWASARSDQSSLSAWRKLGSLATHWAHSEDWSDWADAQADLSLRWAQSHFVGFVVRRLIYCLIFSLYVGFIILYPDTFIF